MANISKEKRDKMLRFLEYLKQERSDDEFIIAINEIESALTEKKYGLVWEHHTENVDEMMKNNIPVFTENKKLEIISNPTLPYNFLLEGDNLHSLKLLEKTHKGKIDVIYIDPPYNRGKRDFIYDDDYIVKEDGYKHSKWLSFMNERLTLARKLLKDQGLIFISIDDNELSQTRLLMDEIFGEINFVNCFIWQRNSSVKTEKDKFTINTEYVLLYSKTRNFTLNPSYKPLSDSTKKMYNKDDGDGRGLYRLYPLQKPRDPGEKTTYDYVDNNGKVWKCPKTGWRMIYEKLKALENDGRLCLTNTSLSEKAYWNERASEGKRIDTLWNDLPENSTGSSELEKVFGQSGLFDNPKPTRLVSRCLEIGNRNAIVLDFFAGSGTTGHAVLELNKEDGGNRKFILCTNNENNICEKVTYQRLKTVITGKRIDNSEYSQGLAANLKYYKTDFVERYPQNDSLSDLLLNHIAEMVQLENAINIDITHILILDESDANDYINESLSSKQTIYIASDVFLSNNQKKLLKDKDIVIQIIPSYYFNFELKEVGE